MIGAVVIFWVAVSVPAFGLVLACLIVGGRADGEDWEDGLGESVGVDDDDAEGRE